MKRTGAIVFLLVFCSFFTFSPLSSGAVMESTTYRMQFDSLNSGGSLSTSTSFLIEDTVGEQATGDSAGTLYSMRAGYQQMQSTYISISSPADPSLGALSGISSGTTTTSSVWTVTTNEPAGYALTVKADNTPALRSVAGAFFDDYDEGALPDFDFSVPSGESAFGFSAEGADISTRFLDDGALCNSGALDTVDRCYEGFTSVDATIASANSSNHPTGVSTTIRFAAGIGANKIQDEGIYTATITVTALPQ
jgi:hypothetical protein